MNDTALFTPKTNPKLFGHEDALAQLSNDLSRGQLAHGWIISGPQGIGKATLVYHFVRTILSGLPPLQITLEHPVFQRLAAGSHSDVLVVEPLYDAKKEEFAREINVEQTREIAQFLSLTPGEGQWRVVLVDSADALNTNSANAILKILEEPPPQTLLFLISHNPGRLLPTLRSRCRQLQLKAPNRAQFSEIMRFIKPGIENEIVNNLGELTNLSAGGALQYLELDAITIYNQILDLISLLPSLDNAKLHAFADKLTVIQTHTNWQLFTKLVLCLMRRVVLTGSGTITPISEIEKMALQRLHSLHPPIVWATKWQEVADQFSLAERLHLDYKQLVIVFFHSLAGHDEFRLGNVAA